MSKFSGPLVNTDRRVYRRQTQTGECIGTTFILRESENIKGYILVAAAFTVKTQ